LREADSRFAWQRKRLPSAVAVGTFLVALVLIAARRPDQIAFPEAWNEDGAYVVRFMVEQGWQYIFVPINGYLIVPSKVISYLAVRISFLYYPLVSTVLGVMTQALCVTAIARAPTVMPVRLAMAAAILFVPTDPETFVLPEYVLWWTPLLIPVALLWAGAPGSLWRYVFVFVGGISAPIVIGFLPFLAVNAVVRRRKQEVLLLVVAALATLIQGYFIANTDTISTATFRVELAGMVVAKFFGMPAWSLPSLLVPTSLLVAGLLAAGVFVLPREDRFPYCLLGGCLLGTIGLSAYRVPVEILSPVGSGPRYFFYPFVLQLWMLIWLAARTRGRLRMLPVAVILAAVPLSVANFQRHQDRLASWTQRAAVCSGGVNTIFEVHHSGIRSEAHHVGYSGTTCREAVSNAILDRFLISER
jgi:hypothetical protein